MSTALRGSAEAQATADTFKWPELIAVVDRATAKPAVETIVEQGEGREATGATRTSADSSRSWASTRRCRLKPRLRSGPVRDVGHRAALRARRAVPRIEDRVTSRCADLFNVGYEVLLQILERYFAHTEEPDEELGTLADRRSG